MHYPEPVSGRHRAGHNRSTIAQQTDRSRLDIAVAAGPRPVVESGPRCRAFTRQARAGVVRGGPLLRVSIPGRGEYSISNVVLDMNGTICLDGALIEGVADRVALLRSMVRLVILTADTHGGAARLRDDLGLEIVILEKDGEAEQKLEFVRKMGTEHTVAIGNGSNDVLMLKESAIGICVMGVEGASAAAILSAEVVVNDIRDALDLLLKPQRLVATLRR